MTDTCWIKTVGLVTCRNSLKHTALVGVLGVSVMMACAPGARAQDGEENGIWNLNERVMKGVMGAIGLKDGSEPEIDYRERSPLVVPPTRDLPPPEAAGAPTNPAWPVDPDQKRRREARTKTKTYLTGTNEDSRPLRPSELDPPGVSAARGGGKASQGGNDHQMLPSELGYGGGLFSWKGLGFGRQTDEVATFKQEPPRTSLSEPPAGYQVPSTTEPYGVTKRTERKATPYDRSVGSAGN